MRFGTIVIGAGIVGLTTALELRRRFPDQRILVLERHYAEFQETSRWNSGVIHSGIHQKPNLLRSVLAREGGPMLVRFCEREGVPHRKAGMIIAVAAEDLAGLIQETDSLWRLWRNSRRQKIRLEFLTKRDIRRLEPNIRASFGLYMSDVWVVGQAELGFALVSRLQKEGVECAFNAEVKQIVRDGEICRLMTACGKVYESPVVVNAAGLGAVHISALAGFPGYRIFPYRGEYYEIMGEKAGLIQNALIYPALPPGHPVKGIHFTKTVHGRLLVGPNAKKWERLKDDGSIRTPVDEFLRGARKFLPDLEADDLRWAYSGIRPKINDGAGEEDFIIKAESTRPTFVNLIGIESPGLTAAFGIAKYVADMLHLARPYLRQ